MFWRESSSNEKRSRSSELAMDVRILRRSRLLVIYGCCDTAGHIAIRDQVSVKSSLSIAMLWHEWVVLSAGSTGSGPCSSSTAISFTPQRA